jgi:hypothetical protein
MGVQNLLSRAPPSFRMQLFIPAAFAVVSTHFHFQGELISGRRAVVKIIAESLSQCDENMYQPHLVRLGKKKEKL